MVEARGESGKYVFFKRRELRTGAVVSYQLIKGVFLNCVADAGAKSSLVLPMIEEELRDTGAFAICKWAN